MATRKRTHPGYIEELPSGSFRAVVPAGTDPLTSGYPRTTRRRRRFEPCSHDSCGGQVRTNDPGAKATPVRIQTAPHLAIPATAPRPAEARRYTRIPANSQGRAK